MHFVSEAHIDMPPREMNACIEIMYYRIQYAESQYVEGIEQIAVCKTLYCEELIMCMSLRIALNIWTLGVFRLHKKFGLDCLDCTEHLDWIVWIVLNLCTGLFGLH